MGDFIRINTNGLIEEESGIVTSSGSADAGKLPKLGADGRLDQSMMPTGIGADMQTRTAGEAISGPAIVRIDSSGNIVNADASLANAAGAAIGFVKGEIANGADGQIYFEGVSSGWANLTVGAVYFLSEIAGKITSTPVTTSGHILQVVGRAVSETEISFEVSISIIRN